MTTRWWEDLYCCIQCPQIVCNICIMVPVKSCSLVRGSDMDFTCPICHKAADRDNSSQMEQAFHPYWVSVADGQWALLMFFSRIPLLTLHLNRF
ncbi:hypothetical protein PAXRUDRAFT_161968 [Paxillus rubicundulus Ve08.2h10]|uniref:Uncharacterized protein n=1 Tax=Paxillus rubicundulus Ve08.2h10 TaxID=930991 RepID=A0A0D0D699_9AGAM|nr:hypothetical protein PAXRUDRAFT_161968 [Paxillus rubicundulus Ve08.2h10]